MAFIPVPFTAEFTHVFLGPNAQRVVNVYHIERPTLGWDEDSLGDMGEAILNWENTTAKAQRSNQLSCIGVECRDISTQNGIVISVAAIPPIVGGLGSPAMPQQVTLTTTFATPFAGRSFRGRAYWNGLAEAQVSGDFVASLNAQAILAAYNNLRTVVIPAVNAQLVVASRFANGAPRVVGVATPVTSMRQFDQRVDTQRRRLVGEGT